MGVVLLFALIVMELFFLIWTITSNEKHCLEKSVVKAGSGALLVVLLLTGVLDGLLRYAILILILVLQSVIGYFIFRGKRDKKFSKGKQIGIFLGNVILYAFALLVAIIFPQHEEPAITGTHETMIKEYTWTDESRIETYTDTGDNRQLTIKVWYPEDEGSYPLVVFSHGAFGVIDSNTSTCTELASNGYVVVSIGHTYQAAYVKDTSGKITLRSSEFINEIYDGNGDDSAQAEKKNYEESKKWMDIRCGDEKFVLDTIITKSKDGSEEPFDRIDIDKIGLFGHSLGGASSVEMGRERSDIDAVIDLEGTMFGEYTGFENGTYSYDEDPYPIPLLDVNSKEVYDQAIALPSEYGETYVNFRTGENAKDFHEVVIDGASHLNFTDLGMVSPILSKLMCEGTASSGSASVNARECIENVNSIVLNFFDYYLKDSGEWNIKAEY